MSRIVSSAPWSCRPAGAGGRCLALLVDDVVQAFGDVVHERAEVVAAELLLAALAQPVEQVAHAGHARSPSWPAVGAAHEQALEGAAQVAVFEEVA